MWLFTRFGFFSVVRKEDDGHVTIRSRTHGDLIRLCRHYLPDCGEPVANAGTDYPWRVHCAQPDFAEALKRIAGDIDYANFKDEVALSTGKARAKAYGEVWSVLYGMKDDLPEPAPSGWEGLPWPQQTATGKAPAFGGVVIDPTGRLLLREAAGHYDGYVWTFAKGRPDPGESPRQTALREVEEEMGIRARILLPVPGVFAGGTTVNHFFLMVVDPRHVDLGFRCNETSGLRWAEAREAASLIEQTQNPTGQQRDLAVLEAALACLPPTPLERPIARREDWKFLPMPAKRATLPYAREFTMQEMAPVVCGFIPTEQEEKWCAVFEDGELRVHRSGTGHQIFKLRLARLAGSPGHWQVEEVLVNRHPTQRVAATDAEEVSMLDSLIQNLLQRTGS